uniref:DNA repair metallo-beta-lactamase domain-containing protein n=1 Tax=Plectus sambesii TaxID=2011161 RepID=A0A914UNY2_9BILA
MNQPQRLQDGTLVTLFDANHCPGSVLFLFETLTGNFLHTGDLRAEDCLIDQLKSKSLPKLDILFLDTTYMNPRYVFPPQKAVIDEVCRFVKTELERYPKTLVVCGTYMIGKERVVQAIAETMGSKIAVNRPKMNIIKCLNDEKLTSRLTLDYKSTNLFVVFGSSSLKQLQDTLAQHSRFHRLINVWPSGWEYRKGGPILSVKPSGNITIVGAPYSEHSSYGELEKLVRALRPARIVPTVNVSKNEEMQKTFSQWLAPANISQIFK